MIQSTGCSTVMPINLPDVDLESYKHLMSCRLLEEEVLRQNDPNWQRISVINYPPLGQSHHQQQHHHQNHRQHPSLIPAADDTTTAASAVRFCVRSLGWTFLSEKEALLDHNSQSVNRNISGFSTGRHNLNDAVGSWGEVQYNTIISRNYNLSGARISRVDMTLTQ